MAARPSRRELQAAWQQRLKRARSLYAEKVAIRKEMLAERRGRVWPINLEPDPDGRFALHLALQEESAARTEYMRILRIANELIREGTLREEEPGLFLVGENRALTCIGSPPRTTKKTKKLRSRRWATVN